MIFSYTLRIFLICFCVIGLSSCRNTNKTNIESKNQDNSYLEQFQYSQELHGTLNKDLTHKDANEDKELNYYSSDKSKDE